MILLVFYIFLQIHYYKEPSINLIKLVLSYTYLFIIPGQILMLNYKENVEFIYRFAIGFGLGIAIQGILVYTLNVFVREQIKYFYWFLPLITVLVGIIILKKGQNNLNKKNKNYQ